MSVLSSIYVVLSLTLAKPTTTWLVIVTTVWPWFIYVDPETYTPKVGTQHTLADCVVFVHSCLSFWFFQ